MLIRAAALCGQWAIGLLLAGWVSPALTQADEGQLRQQLAQRVTIFRDPFGVRHIDARDLPAAVFAFAYCQCEDYFWQVEDSLIWSLGRHAEVNGLSGLESDIPTHAFEIPARSQVDYHQFDDQHRPIAEAFAAGINHYLASHPAVQPRLLKRVEPWHLLALGRRIYLELSFLSNHISSQYMPGRKNEVYDQIGSNAWAIGPSRTQSGGTMLFINPHQPWYGYGQWYEAHLRTDDGIDFYGATFFGSPLPSIGHNRQCGWSFTVNEPDVVDIWNVRFEPDQPDLYRHGDQLRQAVGWQQEIQVKGRPARRYNFGKTHHGPLLRQNADGSFKPVSVPTSTNITHCADVADAAAETVHDVRAAWVN